jgi:hypothetical protein
VLFCCVAFLLYYNCREFVNGQYIEYSLKMQEKLKDGENVESTNLQPSKLDSKGIRQFREKINNLLEYVPDKKFTMTILSMLCTFAVIY